MYYYVSVMGASNFIEDVKIPLQQENDIYEETTSTIVGNRSDPHFCQCSVSHGAAS
jgi:hypothetical protein